MRFGRQQSQTDHWPLAAQQLASSHETLPIFAELGLEVGELEGLGWKAEFVHFLLGARWPGLHG
jgi:hypothetical protein